MSQNDYGEIANVINLYALAVDTKSWSLFERVFTPDIAIDFGGPAAWENLESLIQGFAAIHDPFKSTQHFTTNIHIRLDGDTASCSSYVRGCFRRDVPEGGDYFESTGWYDDVLVRTASGWRIKRRGCRMTGASGNPRVLETAPGAGVPSVFDSLSAEAAKGNVQHLNALLK